MSCHTVSIRKAGAGGPVRHREEKKKEERKGKKYNTESGMRETHLSPVAGDFSSQKADCSFP